MSEDSKLIKLQKPRIMHSNNLFNNYYIFEQQGLRYLKQVF